MSPSKEILEELYQFKKLSINKTALRLHTSPYVVRYWLNKYGIPIRSRVDAAYAQHAKTFSIKQPRTIAEERLFGIGIGLYWGEGNKVNKYSVRLGNTNAELIKTFVKFLREICGIEDCDIKYGLQVFNDNNPVSALEYWCNILECSKKKFHPTISVIPPQGKGSYLKKSTNGVLQVYVNNSRFKKWLLDEIDKLPR